MQFPCCSNPALSKGVQTLSWGSASQAQEAQLRKPDRRSSEDLHSSLSPVPYLHTERAPGPAVHHSDHTESQRLPFLSLFSDSGTGGLLLLPSGQLWVWQPCPASGRLLSFQMDSGPTLNVSSFFILLSGTHPLLKSVWLRMCEAQEQAKLTPVEMEIR